MKQLGKTNYLLISGGVKDFGSFDPKVIFVAFEEALLSHEVEEIRGFLGWVHEDESHRRFGNVNYEARFYEYLLSKNIKTAAKKSASSDVKYFDFEEDSMESLQHQQRHENH